MWDERLNATYASRSGEAEPAYREALRKLQRQWIAYRDAKCGSFQAEQGGGSSAVFSEAYCIMTETARQALWLGDR